MLLVCFGVDALFRLASVSFPASVACLILLFITLLLSEWLLGQHKTRRVVGIIEVPVSSFSAPLSLDLPDRYAG